MCLRSWASFHSPGSRCPGSAGGCSSQQNDPETSTPSTAGTWGAPCAPAPGSAVAGSLAKHTETFFLSCWCFFLAAAWHNWSREELFSVHYQLLEGLLPFLYKAVHVQVIILSFDACFPQPLGSFDDIKSFKTHRPIINELRGEESAPDLKRELFVFLLQ